MSGKRLHSESICRIEIEVLLETVGIEEIIAHPVRGKLWQVSRIKFELDAFARGEHGELVVGSAEENFCVAIARIVASRPRVRPRGAALRVGIHRIACRVQTNLLWIA